MKFKIALVAIIAICFSACSINSIVNNMLERKKIYDDELMYVIDLKSETKTVKLLPIRHLGTPEFYKNISETVSKYQSLGYIVYYEKIDLNNCSDSTKRAFRKVLPLKSNMADLGKAGYKEVLLKNVKKIKLDFEFKKNVVNQPKYDFLISDLNKSKNADISVIEFVAAYEKLYGKIVLDSCDFVDNWDDTKCEPIKTKKFEKLILDYRNQHVVETVLSQTDPKILIIYGEAHMKGIKEGLVKNGFEVLN